MSTITMENLTTNVVKKKSKGHKCYLCGERFLNIHILRKHVNIHKDKEYECPICKKEFSSTNGLRKHKRIHTGERPFPCHICPKRFRQKCTLLDHIQNMHNSNNPKHYCVICEKRIKLSEYPLCWFCQYEGYKVPDNLKFPIAIGDNQKSDENLTVTLEEAVTEINTVEEPEHLIEGIVGSLIGDGTVESHNVEESLTKVSQAIEESDVLQFPNLEDSTLIKPMSCIMCSEVFRSIIELRDHINIMHKPSRPFACDTCGLRFATQMTLTKHMRTHDELRPFRCLTCGRCFKSNVTLQTHLKCHREDRPFSCKTCGSTFKSLMTLRTHQITHSVERPYVCKDCGFTFKTVDRLKKHVIVHSGEKPYRCETCLKEFRHPGNLGRHYYLHLGQRLYICRVCGKDFAQSVGLKQHEQVHNKDYKARKHLVCPVCGKMYILELMLKRHLSQYHPSFVVQEQFS